MTRAPGASAGRLARALLLPVLLALAGCAGQQQAPAAHAKIARADYAPPDAPFSNDDLVRNFGLIAFNLEPMFGGQEIALTRWNVRQPVVYKLVASADERAVADRLAVERHLNHLGSLTGLRFVPAEGTEGVMLWILIISQPVLEDTVATLRESGARNALYRGMEDFALADARFHPCRGLFFADEGNAITGGVALIRDELGEPLRTSCIVEELTQLMGLPNDDDSVRPSIFNDDAEFAALTQHDEFLLRILYANELAPGMTARQARPLVERIVRRLRPAGA